MGTMRIGSAFSVPLTADEALARAEKHLRSVGFKVERGASPALSATRASGTWAFLAFTPRGWRTQLQVSAMPAASGVEVKTAFSVVHTGQVRSLLEGVFWREEVVSLERAIREGIEAGARSRRLAWLTLPVNVVAFWAMLAAWAAPVLAQLWQAPRRAWLPEEKLTMVAAIATGLGLAWMVGRYVFGLFALPRNMPYLKE